MTKAAVRLALFLILAGFCNACILAHLRTSLGELGFTQKDRETSLKKAVKDYHGHLMAGTLGEALYFVVPEKQEEFAEMLRRNAGRERIVEDKIDFIRYPEESSFEANVSVVVKYFEIPRYIVLTRVENEKWIYKGPKKWRLEKTVSKPAE